MGFQKLPIGNTDTSSGCLDQDMGAESEDEDEPATAGTGVHFLSFLRAILIFLLS